MCVARVAAFRGRVLDGCVAEKSRGVGPAVRDAGAESLESIYMGLRVWCMLCAEVLSQSEVRGICREWGRGDVIDYGGKAVLRGVWFRGYILAYYFLDGEELVWSRCYAVFVSEEVDVDRRLGVSAGMDSSIFGLERNGGTKLLGKCAVHCGREYQGG